MQIQTYQPPKFDTKQESILCLWLTILSTVYNYATTEKLQCWFEKNNIQ